MKIIILALSLLLSLNSKALEQPTVSKVHGNVESVVMKTYKLRKEPFELSEKHQPVQIETKKFNKQNRLSEYELRIDTTGGADIGRVKDESFYRTVTSYTHEYDEKGQRIYKGNGNREYDDQGRLLNATSTSDFGTKYKEKYSYQDNKIIKDTFEFNENGKLTLPKREKPREIWEFDNSGRVVSIAYDCEDCITMTYEYNDNNLVVKENYYRNGELEDFISFKYLKFDEKGNWLERLEHTESVSSSSERVEIKVREIQYR